MNIFVVLLPFVSLCVIQTIDPEVELCQDLTIDAAVTADDGNDYIIKGDSYWSLDSLEEVDSEPGKLIVDHWPGLPSPIDAAFSTYDSYNRLSTLFLKDKTWYLYRGSKQLSTGKTSEWPSFPNTTVLGAFDYYNTSLRKSEFPIVFVHNNGNYSRYKFRNIDQISHVITEKVCIRGEFFYFLDIDCENRTQFMDDYMNVTAIIANENGFIFFGQKMLCRGDDKHEVSPRCVKVKEVEKFYNCPRNPRPTTTTTIITTKETTKETTTLLETNPSTIMSETGHHSRHSPLPGEEVFDNKNTSEPEKSDFRYIIVLIVIIAVICVITLIIIAFVRKHKSDTTFAKDVNKNQSKGKPQKS